MPGAETNASDRATAADLREIVMRNSSEVVFTTKDGIVQWISPEITDLVGWMPEEIIGGNTLHLCHPEERDAANRLRELARRGESGVGFFRMRHKDGHFVWVDARVGPGDGPAGTHSVVGSLRPATQRVGAIQRAANMELAYELLAENARDVVATVDLAGVVLEVSPSIEPMLGWGADDIVGTFLPALVHPDDRPRLHSYRREIQAARRPGPFEFRVQSRGGAYRWMSATAARIDSEGGAPVVVMSWRDIDELVREREHAEHETERVRATLDSSLDPRVMMTAIRDAEGTITDFRIDDANRKACDAMGMTRDRLIGTRLLDVFPGVRDHGLLDGYIRAVELGEPLELDDVSYPNELLGTTRRYDMRAFAVGDSIMYAWRDVTARSMAADETSAAARHFRWVASHAADVVLRVENGTITWTSAPEGRAHLFPVGDDLHAALLRAVHHDDRPKIQTMQDALMATRRYLGLWHITDGAGGTYLVSVRAEAAGGGVDARTDVVMTLNAIHADGWAARDDLASHFIDGPSAP